MNYTIKGKLIHIGPIEQITDKFRKRIIVIEPDGERYIQKISISLLQQNCDLVDNLRIRDIIEAEFVIQGKEGKNGKYYNTLVGVRVTYIESDNISDHEQSFSDYTMIGDDVKSADFTNDASDLPF